MASGFWVCPPSPISGAFSRRAFPMRCRCRRGRCRRWRRGWRRSIGSFRAGAYRGAASRCGWRGWGRPPYCARRARWRWGGASARRGWMEPGGWRRTRCGEGSCWRARTASGRRWSARRSCFAAAGSRWSRAWARGARAPHACDSAGRRGRGERRSSRLRRTLTWRRCGSGRAPARRTSSGGATCWASRSRWRPCLCGSR